MIFGVTKDPPGRTLDWRATINTFPLFCQSLYSNPCQEVELHRILSQISLLCRHHHLSCHARRISRLVDCPESSSGQEETIDNGVDDGENIEEQIPSVIPFP